MKTNFKRAALAAVVERLEIRRLMSTTYSLDGVQPIALDQPQINALFRNSATGAPIVGSDSTFDFPGFLDTGTSTVLLSEESAAALGLQSETFGGKTVAFTDVGVGGGQQFHVSNSVYVSLANFSPTIDGSKASDFKQSFGPVRTEINEQSADPLLGPLDIYGMPVLQGKVAVFDPKPIDSLSNMDSYIYNPGTPYNAAAASTNPGIPATDLHVKLSSASFANFVTVTPTGAPGPTLSSNPFIGPDPVSLLNGHNDGTPAVTISNGAYSGSGSFLLDTGAQTSFISTIMAAKVHVHYKPGTEGTANPVLVDDNGKALPNQFTAPIGGIGGTTTAAGFYLDSLTLPTTEGTPIRFTHAPVLVLDVTAKNPTTHQTITLDGDFGMNFLVSSTNASFSATHTGNFKWITIDQPNGLLGVYLPGVVAPATASIAGSLFNDLNADAVHQSSEAGIKGFTITLHNAADSNASTIDATTTTDASGNYSFKNLVAGTYVVRDTLPVGWRATTASSIQVGLTVGQQATQRNFLATQKALISGSVFIDKNGNGKVDTGEGLANWRVYIQTSSVTAYVAGEPTVLTSGNGAWSFNSLAPGVYIIRVVQMSGYKLSAPTTGSFTLTVKAGSVMTSKLFAETKIG